MACAPPKFDRYIEPFLGSACFFLALKPRAAVLGDFNVELISMYKTLRLAPKKVSALVHAMPDSENFYYELRSNNPNDLSRYDRAARFIYLNRYCFNGVYRSNRQNQFNVPRGKHTGRVPSLDEFESCGTAFRGMELRAGDFESCLSDTKKGDFVYLDPPYASVSRLDHGEYGYNSFNEKDIYRLIESMRLTAESGATVLLSYADTPLLTESLDDWHLKRIKVRRFVGGFLARRAEVNEVLISNRPFPKAS